MSIIYKEVAQSKNKGKKYVKMLIILECGYEYTF